MNKVLVLTTMFGFVLGIANGQSTKTSSCGVQSDQVCKVSSDKKTSYCYKSLYAQNFKVCKGVYGYFICCQAHGYPYEITSNLSTTESAENNGQIEYPYTPVNCRNVPVDMTVPQSQSYGTTNSTTYEPNASKATTEKGCAIRKSVVKK